MPKAIRSSNFQWNDEPEVFEFAGHAFDVRAAKELIRQKPRKVEMMNISGIAGLVGSPPVEGEVKITAFGITVNWDKARSEDVDLNIPCLLVPWRDSALPIDGWHRVAKATVIGQNELPYVILTKKELKQIQLY